MSRFRECDYDGDDEATDMYEMSVRMGYANSKSLLTDFLKYLDAMPVKRIIANRFMAPASGEVCAVAAFCASRGFDRGALLDIERDSRLQRMGEGSEDCDGFEGPTVHAGVEAGLPHEVAYDLAFRNDMNWDRISTGEIRECKDDRGYSYREVVYRPMTPEERWQTLRSYVAAKIGEAA